MKKYRDKSAAFKANNRRKSLLAYHRNALEINVKRRRRLLDYYLRQALKRRSVDLAKRQNTLEHSARRMLISKVEQRLRKTLRRRFEKAMKSYTSSSVVLKMTGLPLFDLRAHLERQFKPGMSWFNYGFRGISIISSPWRRLRRAMLPRSIIPTCNRCGWQRTSRKGVGFRRYVDSTMW